MRIQISLDTKFQLKLTILIFRTNLPKKSIWSKTEKVNTITIEFCIFELVCNHFHNILRLFHVLLNFPFTTSEAMRNYYLQTWYIRVASRVAERLKTLDLGS